MIASPLALATHRCIPYSVKICKIPTWLPANFEVALQVTPEAFVDGVPFTLELEIDYAQPGDIAERSREADIHDWTRAALWLRLVEMPCASEGRCRCR